MPGLTRVTITSPQRRVDVALPTVPPVVELLPGLLRHAGEDLADRGERHGGWVLRRPDGEALDPAAGLAEAGVADGDVLYLRPAREHWPELEYDDVVDVIADSARRRGRGWSPAASRLTGLVAAGAALAAGLYLIVDRGGPAAVALGVAAALLVVGTVLARGYADAPVGAALAGFALPYAFVGGFLLPAAPRLLAAGAILTLAAVLGAVATGHGLRVFAAGAVAGLLAVLVAALVDTGAVTAAGGAGVLLAVLVTGVAGLPLVAIRLGRLPMPGPGPVPHRDEVHTAVVRADELLTGMLAGFAAAALPACAVLAGSGRAANALVAVAGVAFLLRARLFATIRQRLPLLVAGGAAVLLLVWRLAADPDRVVAVAVGLAAAGLLLAVAGARYARQAPSPYVGRAADLLDMLCVVSVVPLAGAVLGIYAAARALVS